MFRDAEAAKQWKKLSKKAQACIKDYLLTDNKRESYKAHYKCKSDTVADASAHNFFNRPTVKWLIDHYCKTMQREYIEHDKAIKDDIKQTIKDQHDCVINAHWVLKKASLLAQFNIAKFIRVRDDGTAVYDFTSATEDDWYCIQEYGFSTQQVMQGEIEVGKVKLKTESKLKALEMVGKHKGIDAFNTDDNTGDDSKLADMLGSFFDRAPD